LCALEDFVSPEALMVMKAEIDGLLNSAYRAEHERTPYSWRYNLDFPDGHPRRALHLNRYRYLLYDQFKKTALISQLFEWAPLTEFVRQVLGFETLYRTADPYLSIVVNIMQAGDELAWHFDTNDGVVSLMLQPADEGGHFEYAPYIRDEVDENYGGIQKLFEGSSSLADQPAIEAGTFVLFKGRRSCHRVTPIGQTTHPRVNILYSFDERPGMVFSEASQMEKTQPRSGANIGLTTRP
ncbi:MAG: hypothetical protein QGH08_04185, partial [Arenicellales bacterium]|nr:hypothetical protein [Arenicellales bacterium]